MSGPTAFFHHTYDEAMALLIEARNYAAYRVPTDNRTLSPYTRLQITYESLRVTSRLTQVMAWLLTQKAFYAGELTYEQMASDEFALSGGDICLDPTGPENDALPGGLRSLLDRTYRLYIRVSRLDQQVRHAEKRRAGRAN